MSEEVLGQVPPNPAPALSAGSLLRKARENAGLHVAALAVSMKVPVKKLEALEADRFEQLPDAVFVRALASSVCRTLKVDPAPILGLLPQTVIPRLGTEERSINTPFHASGESHGQTVSDFLKKPVVVLVGALLVGVLLVVLWPEYRTRNSPPDGALEPKPAAEPLMPPASALPPPSDNATGAPAEAPAPLTAEQIKLAAVEIIPSSPVKPVAVEVPKTAPPLVVPVPAPVVMSTPAIGGAVVLKAKNTSWVEVVDAKGVVQIRRVLTPGEKIEASGTLPLAVVIGRVDAVEVEVRGKAFTLEGIAKDNVARFEVK